MIIHLVTMNRIHIISGTVLAVSDIAKNEIAKIDMESRDLEE